MRPLRGGHSGSGGDLSEGIALDRMDQCGRETARRYWSQYHLPPLPLQEHWVVRLWPSPDQGLEARSCRPAAAIQDVLGGGMCDARHRRSFGIASVNVVSEERRVRNGRHPVRRSSTTRQPVLEWPETKSAALAEKVDRRGRNLRRCEELRPSATSGNQGS